MNEKQEEINRLYEVNIIAGWAKNQLRILQEMIDDRLNDKDFGDKFPLKMEWISGEIARIKDGLKVI